MYVLKIDYERTIDSFNPLGRGMWPRVIKESQEFGNDALPPCACLV